MKYLFTPLFVAALHFSGLTQNPDSIFMLRIDSLIEISRTHTSERNYDEAHQINDLAMVMAADKLGENHAAYADCLFNRGRIFHFSKNYEEAERNYLLAEKIQAEVLGTDNIQYSKTLNNLAILKRGQGEVDLAETYFLKVKKIQENSRGKYHPDNSSVINSLGILYLRTGRYEEAEKMYLEVKEIRARAYGEQDVRYADILENLGQLYWTIGQYEQAESQYLASKAIKLQVLGENDPDYAQLLNNIAVLYSDSKRLEAAERLYKEAMAVQENSFGKENSDYAVSLGNLGLLHIDLGKYEEAEANLIEAKDILEKIAGSESLEYAASLDRLASLYFRIGLFDSAEPLFYKALKIRENAESGAAVLSDSYNNLAVLHMADEKFSKAEPLLIKAKEAVEQSTGKENNDYAWCLNNLGILYDKIDKATAAETNFEEANAIREKVFGKDHPVYANGLEDLAMHYQRLGKSAEAEQLHLSAKAIFEKEYGNKHPRYEESIRNLATFYIKEKKLEQAYPLVLEANQLQRELLIRASKHLSEQELAARVAAFSDHLDQIYFLSKTLSPASAGKAYDNVLFHNGFLLNAAVQTRRIASRNATVQADFEKLQALNRRLGEQYALPMSDRENIGKLEQEANELEKQLVKQVTGLGKMVQQVTWQQVQSRLKPNEVAIEFIRFRDHLAEGGITYAALIVKPAGENPKLVTLCTEIALDSLFQGTIERRSDYVAGLYGNNERGATAVDAPKRTLYDLIWKPLEQELKTGQTLHYASSGMLHRLNLGAIAISRRESVADRFQLYQVGSTRQLVLPNEHEQVNEDAVVFGAVQYDIDSSYVNSNKFNEDFLASRNRSRSRGSEIPEVETRGQSLSYLEWTEDELKWVESALNANNMSALVSSGISATEEVFKGISANGPSPRILHVATHGFFFPDKNQSANMEVDADTYFKISDNPMMRSGLVLAGGNHAWTTGKPYRPDLEDGILTAFEISQMDLSNTELVVLSACETGLGDIVGSEGVYGLQRAIKIAGAKYLIMSLWQVPDRQTAMLMESFYDKWLVRKMELKEAFHAAQTEIRMMGLDPYYWAGFVLLE